MGVTVSPIDEFCKPHARVINARELVLEFLWTRLRNLKQTTVRKGQQAKRSDELDLLVDYAITASISISDGKWDMVKFVKKVKRLENMRMNKAHWKEGETAEIHNDRVSSAQNELEGARRQIQLLEILATQAKMLRNIMSHTTSPSIPLQGKRARFCLSITVRFFQCLLHMAKDFPWLAGWHHSDGDNDSDASALNCIKRVLELHAWATTACQFWAHQCAQDVQQPELHDDILINHDPDEDEANLWRRSWHFLAEPPSYIPGEWPQDPNSQGWLERLVDVLQPQRRNGAKTKSLVSPFAQGDALNSSLEDLKGFYDPVWGGWLALELQQQRSQMPWLEAVHPRLPELHSMELRAWLAEFLSQGNHVVQQAINVKQAVMEQVDAALDIAEGFHAEENIIVPMLAKISDSSRDHLLRASPRQTREHLVSILKRASPNINRAPGHEETNPPLPGVDCDRPLRQACQRIAAFGPGSIRTSFKLRMKSDVPAAGIETYGETWALELPQRLESIFDLGRSESSSGGIINAGVAAAGFAAAAAAAVSMFHVTGFSRGSLVARVEGSLAATFQLQEHLLRDAPSVYLSGLGNLPILSMELESISPTKVSPQPVWTLHGQATCPTALAEGLLEELVDSQAALLGILPSEPPSRLLDTLHTLRQVRQQRDKQNERNGTPAAAAASSDESSSNFLRPVREDDPGKSELTDDDEDMTAEQVAAKFLHGRVKWRTPQGAVLCGRVVEVVETACASVMQPNPATPVTMLRVDGVQQHGRQGFPWQCLQDPRYIALCPAPHPMDPVFISDLVPWLRTQWKLGRHEPLDVAVRCIDKMNQILLSISEANGVPEKISGELPADNFGLLKSLHDMDIVAPRLYWELLPFVTNLQEQVAHASDSGYTPSEEDVDAWLDSICKFLSKDNGFCLLSLQQELDLAPLGGKSTHSKGEEDTNEHDTVAAIGKDDGRVDAGSREGKGKEPYFSADGTAGQSSAQAGVPDQNTSRPMDDPNDSDDTAFRKVFWDPATNHPDVPDEYRCAISGEVMVDPVTLETGHVYERRHIKKWFAHGNHTCPMTGVKLTNLKLTASHAFRNTINDFMTKLFQDDRATSRGRVGELLDIDMAFSLPTRNPDTGAFEFCDQYRALCFTGKSLSLPDCQAIASVLGPYTNPDGSIASNKSFKRLELIANGARSEGISAIAKGWEPQKNPAGIWCFANHMAELVIDRNRIGKAGATAVAELLKPRQNTDGSWAPSSGLRKLELHKNNIGGPGAQALAEALSPHQDRDGNFVFCGQLHSLRLIGEGIGDEGAKALAKACKPRRNAGGSWSTNSTLTELTLSANEISDDGAEALARMLTPFEHPNGSFGCSMALTCLDLKDNEIENEGAKALGQALLRKQNPDNSWADTHNLQSLSLYGMEIDGEGVEHLAAAIAPQQDPVTGIWVEGNALQHLNFMCGRMGDRGCKAIAAALEPRRNPDGELVYNANLRSLDIGYSHIGEAGIASLASSLKPRYSNTRIFNTALCSLNLMCNKFDPAGPAQGNLEEIVLELNNCRAEKQIPKLVLRK